MEPKFHHINEDNVLQKTMSKSKFIKNARHKKGTKISDLDRV